MDNITRRDCGMAYKVDDTMMPDVIAVRRKVLAFNNSDPGDIAGLERQARAILGSAGRNLCINPPFACDYGSHIHVGDNFFANYHCTILDVAGVTIGDNVMLAPNVAIYTAGHPVHPATRNSHYEYGIPVEIGNNCWIGGNAVILPGVHIGNNCVIGAGSVVTHDIPDNSIAAGNPCRVIRSITDADRIYYFKHREIDPEAWAEINHYFE